MGFERKRQARDHCDHIGTDFFFFFQKEREIRRRLWNLKHAVTDRDWDFAAKMLEESWVRRWVKTWKPKGEAMESLMVRAGACSPCNAPSRSALQIDSAIEAFFEECNKTLKPYFVCLFVCLWKNRRIVRFGDFCKYAPKSFCFPTHTSVFVFI